MGSSASKGRNLDSQSPVEDSPAIDLNTEEGKKLDAVLKLLKRYDTVIIVDDSGSMQGCRWEEAGEALKKLARVAAQYDEDGLDIFFLNSSRKETGVKDPRVVEQLFQRVRPTQTTPLGEKMRKLSESYLKKYKLDSNIKRVNYIVITDGEPNDFWNKNNLEKVIVKFARELDKLNAPISQVGIQFVQVGDDNNARVFLEKLDNKLKEEHQIRDMVDTSVNGGESDGAIDLVKTLVGAINRRADEGQVILG